MRFMVMVKASKESEAGVMPTEQELAEMGKFNEELVKAGVMLAGEGLQPSSKGARVRFSGNKRTVIESRKSGFALRPQPRSRQSALPGFPIGARTPKMISLYGRRADQTQAERCIDIANDRFDPQNR